MNRPMLRFGAVIGAAALSTLAIAPAFGAAATSQATAQSLDLQIAGTTAVSQQVTATNDGSGEQKNSADTLPNLAGVLPANNLIGAGVAPQDAAANSDGTSYACAGIAGTGGGIVTVGNSSCNLDGQPLSIDLANLDLGDALLSDTSALGNALNNLPVIGDLLGLLGPTLNDVVSSISGAVNGTALGSIQIGGSLSAIEASCTADPDAAQGDTRLVDSTGGSSATPIGITLPNVGTLSLVDLPANPPPNTHVLTDLNVVTQTLVDALTQELDTVVQGQLASLNLGSALQSVQDVVVTQLVDALQPLLQPLEQYLLDITLNKQTSSDGGKKIEVTALDAQVLPAVQDAIGASLIGGQIGHVTCGPNTRATSTPTATPTATPTTPEVPTVVDSGLAGQQDHTARDVLAATGALMLLAASAGLIGYRRMLHK